MKKTTQFKKAFTMIELIFVIVIIGVLSSFALPKLRGLSSSAKISAEIATMSSVLTAIEAVNGEWSINEGNFTWGTSKTNTASDLSTSGYPTDLNSTTQTFGEIIKINSSEYTTQTSNANFAIFTGPASNPSTGVNSANETANKPDNNDFWFYAFNTSTNGCNLNIGTYAQTIYPGDFVLVDVNGTIATDYSTITCN